MKLTLVQTPTEEIITLSEVKNYLRIDHDFDDNLLKMLIKSTREAMESIIQKSVMNQIWRYEIGIDALTGFYSDKADFPTISYGCVNIPLPKPPVIKILSLIANGSEVDKEKYMLERIDSKFCLCFSYKKIIERKAIFPIIITYETGIANKVENIPYQLKLANLMLIANAYQERYSYNQNNVISQGVKQLLTPFLNLRIF